VIEDEPLFPEYRETRLRDVMADTDPEPDEMHVYTSTACHHDLHERCRRVCKFCDQPCGCACHDGEAP
jgi:hypothetical protein